MKVRNLAIVAMLAMMAGNAWGADPVRMQNWIFQDYGDGAAEAWTMNESGSQIGVLCSGLHRCLAYFVSESGTCDEGSKYPALMNSASGAVALSTTCEHVKSKSGKPRYVLVINEFSQVVDSMLKDHVLGIVLPMADGTFKVARFSLEGSNDAIAAVNKAIKAQSKVALRDSVL